MGPTNPIRDLIEILQNVEHELDGDLSVLDEPGQLRRIVRKLGVLRKYLAEPAPVCDRDLFGGPKRTIFLCSTGDGERREECHLLLNCGFIIRKNRLGGREVDWIAADPQEVVDKFGFLQTVSGLTRQLVSRVERWHRERPDLERLVEQIRSAARAN